jgi:hypothetical protein
MVLGLNKTRMQHSSQVHLEMIVRPKPCCLQSQYWKHDKIRGARFVFSVWIELFEK